MFLPFFERLRACGVPVSLREHLAFVEGVAQGLGRYRIDDFYFLARTILVKDERHLDRFDRAFSLSFAGLEAIGAEEVLKAAAVPAEWLEKLLERLLTDEEKAQVAALGGFEALMETLRQRLAEQKHRHQGGSKWIGTAGTSPFGSYGYNPEGVRIGQESGRNQRAVKVWDNREFHNLDDHVALGTRNLKVALRRLRRWARTGSPTELDLAGTLRATAENGYLDVKIRPERHNAVKVILFMDVGGTMDAHIGQAEALFSAVRSEFKHLEHYYFHNCLYETVWRDNLRRHAEQVPTLEVLRTFGADFRAIFIGDAAMSPYEISEPGAAVEHWNAESGETWLVRARSHWPHSVWLNPLPEPSWTATRSCGMIRQIFEDRMYPLTPDGIDRAVRALG